MAKTRPPYPPEFRRQMVELVRAGRSPEELAQEFEPTAQSIRNWVGQAECDAGRGGSGLTTAEREGEAPNQHAQCNPASATWTSFLFALLRTSRSIVCGFRGLRTGVPIDCGH
jgi:transposase-like protein